MQRHGLFARVDQVGVHRIEVGVRPDAENAIL